MGLEEQESCIDPTYQRIDPDDENNVLLEGTYYPQGTVCYTDPSSGNVYVNTSYFDQPMVLKIFLVKL